MNSFNRIWLVTVLEIGKACSGPVHGGAVRKRLVFTVRLADK